MELSAKKKCDLCGKIVAEKHALRFYTIKDYVTVRLDEPTSYVNMEDCTTVSKLHYCWPCWVKITYSAQQVKDGDTNG